MAKTFKVLPHELLFNRRDVPGEYIEMAHIIIDVQAFRAYQNWLAVQHDEAERRNRR